MIKLILAMLGVTALLGCASQSGNTCTYEQCNRPLSNSEQLVVWIQQPLRDQPTHIADDYWIVDMTEGK